MDGNDCVPSASIECMCLWWRWWSSFWNIPVQSRNIISLLRANDEKEMKGMAMGGLLIAHIGIMNRIYKIQVKCSHCLKIFGVVNVNGFACEKLISAPMNLPFRLYAILARTQHVDVPQLHHRHPPTQFSYLRSSPPSLANTDDRKTDYSLWTNPLKYTIILSKFKFYF